MTCLLRKKSVQISCRSFLETAALAVGLNAKPRRFSRAKAPWTLSEASEARYLHHRRNVCIALSWSPEWEETHAARIPRYQETGKRR